jgi:restriction endonuclease Mrr
MAYDPTAVSHQEWLGYVSQSASLSQLRHSLKSYLSKAGFVELTRRGHFRITRRGSAVLHTSPRLTTIHEAPYLRSG